MYATIRRLKIKPHLMQEVIQRTEQSLLPFLSNEPGFIEFDCIQIGENEAVSVSIFKTREEAEEGNRKAIEWARGQLYPLAEAPAQVVGMGAVLLHRKNENQ